MFDMTSELSSRSVTSAKELILLADYPRSWTSIYGKLATKGLPGKNWQLKVLEHNIFFTQTMHFDKWPIDHVIWTWSSSMFPSTAQRKSDNNQYIKLHNSLHMIHSHLWMNTIRNQSYRKVSITIKSPCSWTPNTSYLLQSQLYEAFDAVGAHKEPASHHCGESHNANQECHAAKEGTNGENNSEW